ncbi:MAG: guanylate kinase [Spirochaetes bacterium]|nr:guanylate kinase [Spirochaetota bacterium]
MKANNPSIVISAPSGAGKTTLINRLLSSDDRLTFSVSTTTRPRRSNETDGKSYYFIAEDAFRGMVDRDEFIEWARVHGNCYGTSKKEIDRICCIGKIPIFDVDVQGAKTLKGRLDSAVYIFIVPPSREVLESRLRNRKTDSEEQIQIRLRNAIREMEEYAQYDYIVINDDLDVALNELRSIVTAELCKAEYVNHIIIEMLEECSDNSDR